MKKTLLTTAAIALLSAGMMAQTQGFTKPVKKSTAAKQTNAKEASTTPVPNRGCGTAVPTQQWDEAFNKMVEEHKQNMQTGRASATTYTIPIIFHIIHEGEAVGVGHNISQAQINSQIPILNADYNGTGFNSSMYATFTNSPAGTPAFYDYAHANTTGTNSVSPASLNSGGGIAIGVSGIYFCLATKDPNGNTLAEPGIERKIYSTYTTTKPSASSDVQTLFDGTIKPASIWDPTKYFNVWVSDGGSSGLLGYATFPPVSASSLSAITSSQNGGSTTGSFGETNSSTPSQVDGVWVSYNAVGNTGAAASPYQYGRSLTHESGHWLGLRHIWGDGTCTNDYCNDTPPAAASNINLVSFPSPKYPFHKGTCTSTPNNNTDGEMYMNFMDYSGDAELWMFTNDQVNRFHAALASSPYRSGLTTSAASICAGVTTSTPVASFTFPSTICANASAVFTDASSGPPTSWAWSVNPSTSVTVTTSSSQNPTITFPAAGTYTVTLAATNTQGSNSTHSVVTVGSCTTSTCDTVSNMLSTDTLTLYNVSTGYMSGSGVAMSGTVSLTSQAVGEIYSSSTFPTNVTQVKGAMILFFRDAANNVGTKGSTGSVTVKMTNTTSGSGGTVPSTSVMATQTVSVASIVAGPQSAGVDYAGNQLFDYTGYMIAYPVMFSSAVTMPSSFALTVTTPTAVTADTIAIWSNSGTTAGATATGCVQYKSGTTSTWYNSSVFGINPSFAIIPIVCPTVTTSIENNILGNAINLFPNPNNGMFNFSVTLSEATNLNFTVTNMLGQVVYTKSENNITNAVLSCDLSNLAKGVYYANITDGKNNKTVKKIIIE